MGNVHLSLEAAVSTASSIQLLQVLMLLFSHSHFFKWPFVYCALVYPCEQVVTWNKVKFVVHVSTIVEL